MKAYKSRYRFNEVGRIVSALGLDITAAVIEHQYSQTTLYDIDHQIWAGSHLCFHISGLTNRQIIQIQPTIDNYKARIILRRG